jgi:NIMA (never in mitosis gene a)-related kinase 2
MNHLNKKNIIHRDLKFENILIKNGQVKISDFGFAKPIGEKMSVYSVKCGTPYTMAP